MTSEAANLAMLANIALGIQLTLTVVALIMVMIIDWRQNNAQP